jgi:hypothetical protein
MRTTLGTVDLIQMLQGELEFRCEGFSPCAQFARWERRELVEEWLYHSWV